MAIDRIFKPYILNSGGYKGGLAAKASDRKIYKLSSNENYFGTSPKVHEAIKERLHFSNIYPSGNPAPLYQALADFYEGQLNPYEHFIAGNSGSELIQLICRAVLQPGDECILSTPCFAPYSMFASWSGAKIIDIPLQTPEFSLDVSGIIQHISDRTRIIFLTSPNNPTGTCIQKSELEEILEHIPDHVVILFDEVYYQYPDNQHRITALPYALEGANIVGLNSFSKAYGMASMRLGYAYSNPTLIHYFQKLIRPFLINDLSLHGGIAALQDQSFLKAGVKEVQVQRDILFKGLQGLGLECWPSQANFVLVRVEEDDQEFAAEMAQNGVMVRPTYNFGAPGCIRITVGDAEATQATLTAIATILTK